MAVQAVSLSVTSPALCSNRKLFQHFTLNYNHTKKKGMHSKALLWYTTVYPFTTHAGKLLDPQYSQMRYFSNMELPMDMNNASSIISNIREDSINNK